MRTHFCTTERRETFLLRPVHIERCPGCTDIEMTAVAQHLSVSMYTDRLRERKGGMICILQRNLRSKTQMFPDTGQRKQRRQRIQRNIVGTEHMKLSLPGICGWTKTETAALIGRVKGSDKSDVVKMLSISGVRDQIGGKYSAKDHTLDGNGGIYEIPQRKKTEEFF